MASFTSASGPGIAHYGGYIFDSLKRPYRPVQFVRAIDRILRLAYWYPFAAPVVAPAVFKRLMRRSANKLLTDHVPAEQRYRSDTAAIDLVNSLKIYRSLAVSPPTTFPADRYVSVPVQLIVGAKDPVVRPHGFDDLSRWVPRLWRRDINAGHWSPMSHPQVLAAGVAELVDFLEGKPASRSLLRAQVGRKRDDFGDTLVSVTGAGSGIGRETALAFARSGAELIVSDVDEATVKDTAAQIVERGGVAHPYVLDVSDAEAVERFADEVCAKHGVPDIVVNNAGIGQAGEFLEHACRSVGAGAGRQPRRCRQRLQGIWEAPGRARHRRTHRQCRLDGVVLAVEIVERLLHVEGRRLHVLRLPACGIRRRRHRAHHGLPGHHRYQHRAHHPVRRSGPLGRQASRAGGSNSRSSSGVEVIGPDKAAKAIVSAVKKNKPIRPITPEAYLLYGTSRVAPQVMRSTARVKLV